MKSKGVEIVFHLVHAGHNSTWKIPVLEGTLRTRASENGYYVVSANDVGPLQMVQSIIVDPKGLKLAQANMDAEEMITANLDLRKVSDEYFEKRRNDLYRLQLLDELAS